MLWATDNSIGAVGAVGLPLAAYGAYIHYAYPGMPFSQKIARSSLLGQLTVLSSLGLVAALSYAYTPPEAARATLRKHMTAVRPQAEDEQTNLASRKSSIRRPATAQAK